MTALNFGPEWLRNLTGSGSLAAGAAGLSVTAPFSSSIATDCGGSSGTNSSYPTVRYKLAEHRYGREEMLALFVPPSDIPAELKEHSFILETKMQTPLALEPMSKEEQSLLLQCVNSVPMLRSMGRGSNSLHSGRGEGRGRGRGRDEDGLGKMRTRDIWDDRSGRGFERGYSAYGSDDGPGLPSRDLSRSVSIKSWRENRQHHEDDELDFRKQDRDRRYDPKDRYGPKNWREPRNDRIDHQEFDDTRRGQPPTDAVRRIEYKRSRSSGSSALDEETLQTALPEWSTANPNDLESVGSFDSSGAFLPVKEKSAKKPDGETASSSLLFNPDVKPCKSLPCDIPTSGNSGAGSLSASETSRRQPPTSLKDQISPNSLQLNGMAPGSSSSGPSPAAPASHGAVFPQHASIDSVNSRTVDGAGCELNDPSIRGHIAAGHLGNEITRTGDMLALSSSRGLRMPVAATGEQDLRNVPADVAGFVSKWAGESDGKFSSNGQPGDLGKAEFVDDQWFYKDPQGDVQGPFTNAEMNEWLKTGYFTMNLLVRRGADGDFSRLGDTIRALGYVPFEPRMGLAPSVYSNPGAALPPPIASGLNQQQQQQQQLQQKVEQLRKMQQAQTLAAMQRQQQDLLSQDYLRQLQVAHQQQIQQLLHLQQQQQQTQVRLPQLHVPEGFGMMLPPQFDPILGPIPAHPLATIHPSVMPGSGGHILPPSQLPASNPSAIGSVGNIASAASSAAGVSDGSASSKHETDVPPTVEQIEKLQFLVLEKEREEKRMELHRLEEWKILEQHRKAEEERQMMEERRRVELERLRLEEERRNLEELHRQMEHDRQLMEEKLQTERMESERRLMKQREEEERQEKERMRLEEENARAEKQRQEEAAKKATAEKKRKQAELEARQKAEADARQKAEAEAKQKADAAEAKRQAEAVARQKAEAEARQKEEAERKKQALLPPKSPWSNSGGKSGKSDGLNQLTLSEIQEAEKLEFAEEHQRFVERQKAAAASAAASFEQAKQLNASWNAPRSQPETRPVPSLWQIQQEQEKQLSEGGAQEKSHLLSAKVAETPFGGPSIWKSGAQPIQWNKGGNTPGSTWAAVEPAGKKKTSVPVDNNSQFPALRPAAVAPPSAKKSSSNASKSEKGTSKTKKEEDVVQKLFHVTKVRDELTEWCEKVLNGLKTSVDIPTLVDLLKDIESPLEVSEYVRMYLGESKQVQDFTQQFLERRSKLKGVGKQKPSEDVWGGKSSVNAIQPPSMVSGKMPSQQQQPKASVVPASLSGGGQRPVAKDVAAEKSKGKKKKKMQKVDSSILGFNVCANSDRTNIGDIDTV